MWFGTAIKASEDCRILVCTNVIAAQILYWYKDKSDSTREET